MMVDPEKNTYIMYITLQLPWATPEFLPYNSTNCQSRYPIYCFVGRILITEYSLSTIYRYIDDINTFFVAPLYILKTTVYLDTAIVF